MDLAYFLLADAPRLLGCKPYRIVYPTGQVPEPRQRIGGKRFFTINDIYRLAEKMQVELVIARGEV